VKFTEATTSIQYRMNFHMIPKKHLKMPIRRTRPFGKNTARTDYCYVTFLTGLVKSNAGQGGGEFLESINEYHQEGLKFYLLKKQARQKTYNVNMDAPSRNHSDRVKAISIIYSECMCLLPQLSSMQSESALLYCHLLPFRLYHMFPRYLTNSTILNIKLVF
jgi:hypothetical protein